MKRVPVVFLVMAFLLNACKESTQEQKAIKKENPEAQSATEVKNDTLIVLERKGEREAEKHVYFPVVNKDTIPIKVSFGYTMDEALAAEIRFHNSLAYREQYVFLKLIFRKASEASSFYKLAFIDMNTLPSAGDLSIDVTRQLMSKYEDLEMQLNDYKKASELLMDTKITSDFNMLLKPYSMEVSGYDLEKVFMVDKEYLFKGMTLETNPQDVPDKVLEALVWMKIQRKAEK